MSCTRRARLAVPAGTPVHDSGGDWLAPSHVYCCGMAPPFLKAELVSSIRGTASAVVEVAGAVVDDPFLVELPLDPHATAVTRRTRASLRSTRLFYPERGLMADGVEPSTV